MSHGAHLESLAEMRRFRSRLIQLGEQTQAALDEAEGEITRTADWLAHTQKLHWETQLRVRSEEFTRAKSALNRKKNEKSPLGGRQSYVEEEQEFKKAERRLEEARRKSAAVKHWTRKLDEAAFNYRPTAQALRSTVELDVARGAARLGEMLQALEAYLAGGPPPAWAVSESGAPAMDRALPESKEAQTAEAEAPPARDASAADAERAS